MTVKAIRHHQSFAGRDADDAHAQYLLASCGSLDEWDDAYTHSQVISGNPHNVRLCEICTPTHNFLTGRDAIDAHEQYLRLANTSTQTMAGSLDLGANTLYAGIVIPGTIIGCCGANLIIKACDDKTSHLTLMGSSGEGSPFAGNVYIKTAYNCTSCKSGTIFIVPGTGGTISMSSDKQITLESDCNINIEAEEGMLIYADLMCVNAVDIVLEAEDVAIFGEDSVDITSPHIDIDGDVALEGFLEICGCAKFMGLSLCNSDDVVLLDLVYEGGLGDSVSPTIAFAGCDCDDYADCASFWDGVSTGKNNAKYCLDGGIFINVNGCHRYIKFHRPLS